MKKIYYIFLTILIAFPTFAQVEISPQQSTTIDEYIQTEMQQRQIPGLALAVCYKGQIIEEKGYGMADVQHQVPVTTNTVFELASITKQFTASSIMILVQEGKVDIDDEIHTYLTDAPDNWKGVTVRHLMTHTSGLPDMAHGFSGFDDPSFGHIGIDISAEKGYRAAKADTLNSAPGEKYTYSDVGYFLLGLIIQKASSMPYREFMQQKIFDPVGMNNTYILDQAAIHPNEARGYTLRDGELVNIRRVWQYEVPSHYGIFSTLGDLAKWDSVLYTEEILTEESKNLMWSPFTLNSDTPYPYGFGWKTWKIGDRRIIDHTGITGTEIIRMPNDSLTVIVLTNLGRRGSTEVNAWGLAPEVADRLGHTPYIGKDYVTLSGAKVVESKDDIFSAWVGEYKFSEEGTPRKIYVEAGKLWYDRGNSRSLLAPLDNGQLLMLEVIDEWTLEALPGEPEQLQWYLNGEPAGVMTEVEPEQ